jgi:hypothetical protein
MIAMKELQYLFGVPLLDVIPYKAHLWAYAWGISPEKAVIEYIRAGFHRIMASHPNDSYFDQAFSKYLKRPVVAPRVRFAPLTYEFDDLGSQFCKPMEERDTELLELVNYYYRGKMCEELELAALIFDRDYLIDRETEEKIPMGQEDIVRVGLDFANEIEIEGIDCIHFDRLLNGSTAFKRIAIYFSYPNQEKTLEEIDEWARHNECTIDQALLDTFHQLVEKLLIPKNGINFFDQLFSEEVNQKVSAPPITIETYEKKGKTLPLLMIQGYELTPENSNKKLLIRDAMVRELGQKMAEFGFRYEDYRRRE